LNLYFEEVEVLFVYFVAVLCSIDTMIPIR